MVLVAGSFRQVSQLSMVTFLVGFVVVLRTGSGTQMSRLNAWPWYQAPSTCWKQDLFVKPQLKPPKLGVRPSGESNPVLVAEAAQ